MELEYWANDKLSYLEKTLQKPFDCHKTVIIKVVRGKRRKKGGEHSRGAKGIGEYVLVSRDFLEREHRHCCAWRRA